MKVGDLVIHKRFNVCYLVAKVDNSELVGVIGDEGEIKYIGLGWLRVISDA